MKVLVPDCSDALTAIPFTPFTFPYNNAGSSIIVTSTYEALFTHIKKVDCPLNSCELLDEPCSAAFASPDVSVDAAPAYKITATELNPLGFHHRVCVRCQVLPTGTTTPLAFDNKPIEIIGIAVDCSGAFEDKNFLPSIIEYD